MSTLEPRTALSVRAKFDIAALFTAGAASTVFLLLPVWASLDRSTESPVTPLPQLAAKRPAIDVTNAPVHVAPPVDPPTSAPAPRRRAGARPVRLLNHAPAPVVVQAPAKPPQSRLARLVLGDGRVPVRPFPLPASQ